MDILRVVVLVLLSVGLAFFAIFIIQRSIGETFKALKLALKSEFTTNTGKLNLVAMVLFAVVMLVFNLHEMIASALSVDGQMRAGDHVIAPALLLILLFIGSLVCVVVVEVKK
ncbi:MAG TPA: hypothetical protein VJW20_06210 [Candidatus Angelobacter sp.]|nr:hypothetical protein [Candidatus Angelobacter sp.]